MNIFNNFLFANETIAHQKDDIVTPIATLVDNYRKSLINKDTFTKDMSNFLTKRFGLKVEFGVSMAIVANAWAYPNTHILSHPFYTDGILKMLPRYWIKENNVETANIDLINAHITGTVCRYPAKTNITFGLLNKRKINLSLEHMFTPEEIAAIILHEMGHLFTFIEYVTHSSRVSALISTRTQELIGTPKETRVKLINSDELLKNYSKEAKEDLAEVNDPESISLIIYTEEINKVNNAVGMNYYSTRYCEQAADMFAIRCGASKYLSSGLLKMNNGNSFGLYPIIVNTIYNFFTYCTIPIITAILSNFSYEGQKYDDPKDRIRFIKRQLVDKLKTVTDKEEKEKILKSISEVDKCIRKLVEDPIKIDYYINYLLSGRFRESKRQQRTMKQIEELIDNDLYVAKAKLDTFK